MSSLEKKAIIIGAGPAGLTVAYELLTRTDIKPIILEKSEDIGGISKTVNYKGNRIDIGGHRFFSKSDRVMRWWLNILPPAQDVPASVLLSYQGKEVKVDDLNNSTDNDKVMLLRHRLSRIFFLGKFFDYPLSLSPATVIKLGLSRTCLIGISYLYALLRPRRPEKSLEDFFINRFGYRLYVLFFRDYTQKVWGHKCSEISAEWGAQRIKGLDIRKALKHALAALARSGSVDLAQKKVETSLIDRFFYPRLGPGQLWEEVANQIKAKGGQILKGWEVNQFLMEEGKIKAINALNQQGETMYLEGDYFFSTMPVQDLIPALGTEVPPQVQEVAAGLQYRDFITVGVLLRRLSRPIQGSLDRETLDLKDNWIYIQERKVKVGRLQIFNNWSPDMVADPDTVWIGMEFFCQKTDAFWKLSDPELIGLAITELEKIGLASYRDVLDHTVIRMEKTYPAYFGAYVRFPLIRQFTDQIPNLFLVGRNGMHKYNNADHSMLTAITAVDNIIHGVGAKDNIWEINTEQEYHEERVKDTPDEKAKDQPSTRPLPAPGYVTPELKPSTFAGFMKSQSSTITPFLIVAMLCWAIFKYFYPFASFIHGDSFAYMNSAYHNLPIYTYPIGYSRFLRLFSVFSNSDLLFTSVQYVLLQGAMVSLLYTVFFFHNIKRWMQLSLLVFFTLNPVNWYIANLVSSDCLFLTLSISWLATLIWVIHRPSFSVMLIHGLVLFVAFTVRYNALFYPFISLVAIFFGRKRFWLKVSGITAAFLAIGIFISYTSGQYQKLSGIRQFSPFSSWQLANNALYAYKFVEPSERKKLDKRFTAIDQQVRTYFDSTKDHRKYPQERLIASTYYMWHKNSPLRTYMQEWYKADSGRRDQVRWAKMGPLLKDYGTALIKAYPSEFWYWYLRPNLLKYYAPPVEYLENYNMNTDTVASIAKNWFAYSSNKVYTRTKDRKVSALYLHPIIAGMMNAVFVILSISFLSLGGLKEKTGLFKIWLLFAFFWLCNIGFSVFASPIALRFQLFPFFACSLMDLVLLDYLLAYKPVAMGKLKLKPQPAEDVFKHLNPEQS